MYFKVFQGSNGQWYWSIRGGNHERMATSEGYKSKQSALDAIAVVKQGAAKAPITE
jgi:uncharacterized protein YegP (UPF0339 family)